MDAEADWIIYQRSAKFYHMLCLPGTGYGITSVCPVSLGFLPRQLYDLPGCRGEECPSVAVTALPAY